MKTKTTNHRPFSVTLEESRFDTFVLNFIEHRGDTRHQVRVHLDAHFIRVIAYRVAEQMRYAEKELVDIKAALRNAGGGS